MDQKHNMLYPPIEPYDPRVSVPATSTMGAPPSYDMAMGAHVHTQQPHMSSVGFSESTTSGVTVIPYDQHARQSPNPYIPPSAPAPDTPNNNIIVNLPNTNRQEGNLRLGPDPCNITCPACGERNITRVNYTSNTFTHLYSLVLCVVGWYCCACFIPYCMNSCRTGNHYCSECNTYLGVYKRAGRK